MSNVSTYLCHVAQDNMYHGDQEGHSVKVYPFLASQSKANVSEPWSRTQIWTREMMVNRHQCSSVAQSCPTLCDPMNHSTSGLPVHHQLPEFTQTHRVSDAIESVMPSSRLILCRPLLLLPPISPSIRVFSNESTLRLRWPKYQNFSFSIIPS